MEECSGPEGVDLAVRELEQTAHADGVDLNAADVPDAELVSGVDRGREGLDRRKVDAARLHDLFGLGLEAEDVDAVSDVRGDRDGNEHQAELDTEMIEGEEEADRRRQSDEVARCGDHRHTVEDPAVDLLPFQVEREKVHRDDGGVVGDRHHAGGEYDLVGDGEAAGDDHWFGAGEEVEREMVNRRGYESGDDVFRHARQPRPGPAAEASLLGRGRYGGEDHPPGNAKERRTPEGDERLRPEYRIGARHAKRMGSDQVGDEHRDRDGHNVREP